MLVAAKCTQCGANIEVESTLDAGICPNCGTAFITEKAVHNYNTTNITHNTYNTVNNIQGGEVHIHQGENSDKLYSDIKGLITSNRAFSEWGNYTDLFENLFTKFELLNPLDYRVCEIKVMLMLKKIEKQANLKGAIYGNIDLQLLDELLLLNPEVGKPYYDKVLKLVNDDLNKRIKGFTFSGDMLDLKILLNVYGDSLKVYIDECEESRRDFLNSVKLHEEWAKKRLSAEPIIIKERECTLNHPYLGDEKIINMIDARSHGLDVDYVYYIYTVANKYKNKSIVWKGNAAAFINELKSSIPAEIQQQFVQKEKERELQRKNDFYAKYEKIYLEKWTQYVNAPNAKAAYQIISYMANGSNKVPYADFIANANFKKGLFGVKKLSNVPDNDAKALTKQSVDFAYKEFLNGKFKD